MATAQRIYLVTLSARARLVRAATQSQALYHVARDMAKVKVASQDELLACIVDGVKVEIAGTVVEDETQ